MAGISQIMIEQAQANTDLLKATYRDPGITAYNRMEPRPRTENFERGIRAEIRDPLWMLTRQWQMGELEAEDAGSAIDARILTSNIQIDRIAIKNNQARPYDNSILMESFIEKEAIPFTYSLKVQMGQYFLKLHPLALRNKYKTAYFTNYALEKNRADDFKGQTDGLNLYIATADRALDGEKIYSDIINGRLTITITFDGGDVSAINDISTLFKEWFTRQYTQPADKTESAWQSQQLEYKFAVAAPSNANNSQVVLKADQYYNGHLDWYSFDKAIRDQSLPMDGAEPFINNDKPVSFIPTLPAFKGMPSPRFWEMEDRQIDFGKLNAKTTDQLMLVLAEFGLIYSNDWFVIPYKIPVNTICEIKGLVVTDVFGDRTLIPAAGEGEENDWQHWTMFSISNERLMGEYNRLFFLPATVGNALESEPIEEVNFIRDEMANMVWGIEDIIPDGTGKGINGDEAADKTGVLPPEINDSPAVLRYLLGATVPENWIPFMPVQKPGSIQQIYFQRAAMPKLGVPPKDVIKAKGVLLNEVPSPYFINPEEIPYAGTVVTRTYQRTRSYNGETAIWIGRKRTTGRGKGNSKLRFDQAEPLNKQA